MGRIKTRDPLFVRSQVRSTFRPVALMALVVVLAMLNPYTLTSGIPGGDVTGRNGAFEVMDDGVHASSRTRGPGAPLGPTDPPSNLDIGKNGNDIHLRWDDMGSDGYNVYRATSKWAQWPSGWSLLGGGNPSSGITCDGTYCKYVDPAAGNMTNYPPSGPAASDYFYIVRSYHSGSEIAANSTMAYKLWVHHVPNNGTYGTEATTDNFVVNLPSNTTARGYAILKDWCQDVDPPVGSSQPTISSCNKWRERSQSYAGTFWFDPPGFPPPTWAGSSTEPLEPGNGTMLVLKDSPTSSPTHALDWAMVGTDLDLTINRRPNDGTDGTSQRTENMVLSLPITHNKRTLGEILDEIDPTLPGNDVVASVCKWVERSQNWRCAGWVPEIGGWGGATSEEVFSGNGTMVILRDDTSLLGYNPGLIAPPVPWSGFNTGGA